MDKKEQLLIIDPPIELKFRGPFTVPVATAMVLENPTNERILFKIKTTAPRKYCVRPNFGSIEPQDKVIVTICLQAFQFDPNEKNKHKFMVQSAVPVVQEGVLQDIEKQWTEVPPEQLMNTKLKCVFELPFDAAAKATSETSTVESANSEISGKDKDTSIKTGNDDFISNEGNFDYGLATEEILQLREQASQLRRDNFLLKEQIERLKLTEAQERDKTGMSSAHKVGSYSPPSSMQEIPMATFIWLAIAILGVGLLIGKVLL